MNLTMKQVPRECGTCRLCCKVMGVQEGDFHKPKDRWCPHAGGKGCTQYETRPTPCRDFTCLWLTGWGGPEHRPDQIHGVLTATADGANWVIHEDPGYEGHARRVLAPYIRQWLDRAADPRELGRDFYVVVVCGTKRSFLGDRRVFDRLMASGAAEVVGASDVVVMRAR